MALNHGQMYRLPSKKSSQTARGPPPSLSTHTKLSDISLTQGWLTTTDTFHCPVVLLELVEEVGVVAECWICKEHGWTAADLSTPVEENVYGVCSQEPNTEANWGRGEAPKVRPAAGRWDNVAVAAAAAGLKIKEKRTGGLHEGQEVSIWPHYHQKQQRKESR